MSDFLKITQMLALRIKDPKEKKTKLEIERRDQLFWKKYIRLFCTPSKMLQIKFYSFSPSNVSWTSYNRFLRWSIFIIFEIHDIFSRYQHIAAKKYNIKFLFLFFKEYAWFFQIFWDNFIITGERHLPATDRGKGLSLDLMRIF